MDLKSLEVTDFQNNTIDLKSKYPDQTLLLLFYNNSCIGCTGRAVPLAHQLQQEYDWLQVVGIHSNFGDERTDAKKIKSIFTIDELPFPIYIDEEHRLYDQIEAEGTPHWLVVRNDGIIENSIFGSMEGAKQRLFYTLEGLNDHNT